MSGVRLPAGFCLERLRRGHPRDKFHCGEQQVDDWLATKALQQQQKHLSVTKALLDEHGGIAGYYTLATGQVDFSDLPAEISRHMPERSLPVAVLAWLGVASQRQGQGLGTLLLAQSLRDCWEAGKTFPFVAVILDSINDTVKTFYERWDFAAVPGHPNRLFLSARRLAAMMEEA